MYGKVMGVGSAGTGGAALASTGFGLNILATVVAMATLIAAGAALYKLAPRFR
ncbi:hypothetical protein GCM10027168_45650 [Streptomyces capparidis]